MHRPHHQVTTNEVVEYKALKSKRMTAAIEEEGDLLTYSALAIRDAHSYNAEAYRRRLLVKFPEGELTAKAACHLDLAHNPGMR